MATNQEMIGRDEINDLEAILSITIVSPLSIDGWLSARKKRKEA